MILTMLYSWFMAKCNQVYSDMFYELVGDKLYLFWFLIPKMLQNTGVSIRTVFLNFHFFKKMSIFGTELFAYRFVQMVQNGTKHQIQGSSIQDMCKIFRKINISYPLIRTHPCAYQGVRNVSFSKNFVYVLNG